MTKQEEIRWWLFNAVTLCHCGGCPKELKNRSRTQCSKTCYDCWTDYILKYLHENNVAIFGGDVMMFEWNGFGDVNFYCKEPLIIIPENQDIFLY